MPGHKNCLLRRKFGISPLPVAALAAVVAGLSTLVIWQSPRNIVAEVKPLIMDFGTSRTQSSSPLESASDETTSQQDTSSADESGVSVAIPNRRSDEPIRTQRSNGGLVLEWPRQRSASIAASTDARTQALQIMKEAEDHLRAGDLRRALNSARLAYSYPVKWEAHEQKPEELLKQLEALANDPAFTASTRQQVINRINSANDSDQSSPTVGTPGLSGSNLTADHSDLSTNSTGSDIAFNSIPDRQTAIGVWKPAPSLNSGSSSLTSTGNAAASGIQNTENQRQIETASASEMSEHGSQLSPVLHPYQSQPSSSVESGAEPRRLNLDTRAGGSESTAEFATPPELSQTQFAHRNELEQRPLIITDQRAAAPATSPVATLTFDVLATLTTIFAVLFFGTLFLFLAVLAIGKKLIGESGVAFRIELVNNSPLTIQTGAPAAVAAAATETSITKDVTQELKLDPDFEGILSLSEQRARQRESAILQQFIENNVSLHNEISASRSAA
ncbi:MAG: hypothetical protein HQ518_10885 [Rhodopirellula sp.]|nr:hypothetical protein [Rhodopirellula sp.]